MATAHGGQTVLSEAVGRAGAGRPAGGGGACATWARTGSRTCSGRSGWPSCCTRSCPADFPPLRSLDALPHNLPRQGTPFIGREAELAAVVGAPPATRTCPC